MTLEMGNGGGSPVDVSIRRETTKTLTLLTGDSERVRIDASGNVGIGTKNPGQKLDVAGNIHASGSIEVSNGYIKLDNTSSGLPADDCDASDEVGRMKVSSSLPILYVCTASGWAHTLLFTATISLPVIGS
jgi:hypothetical protein